MEHLIINYQSPDVRAAIEASLQEYTSWLSLKQLLFLFERDQSVLSKYILNLFTEVELVKDSAIAKFATTASDDKTYQVEKNIIVKLVVKLINHRN